MSHLVFGYGSLINTGSIGRGLGREVSAEELTTARLSGFRRDWLLIEQVYSEQRESVVNAAFLDLRRQADSWVNGVVFEVSPSEYEQLVARERKYQAVDITDETELFGSSAGSDVRITTFVGIPMYRSHPTTTGPLVMANYRQIIEVALKDIGPEFTADFGASTDGIPFPILDGRYTFIDPAQAASV